MEFLTEKLTFLVFVHLTFICVFAASVYQWLIVLLYAGMYPVFLLIRLWFYIKVKWQLFMLDFCYLTNLVCFTYIWAGPRSTTFFAIIFSMAHGPVLSAAVMYRNSLVFHSLDRMSSCFFHLLPPMLTFAIRWYPERIVYWMAPFVVNGEMDLKWQSIWLCGLPLGVLMLHTFIYFLLLVIIRTWQEDNRVVEALHRGRPIIPSLAGLADPNSNSNCGPSREYLGSYSYLTEADSGMWPKLFKRMSPTWRPYMYMFLLLSMGAISFALNLLWYNYYYANLAALLFVFCVLVWNSSTFYIDVFRKKGLDCEPYKLV